MQYLESKWALRCAPCRAQFTRYQAGVSQWPWFTFRVSAGARRARAAKNNNSSGNECQARPGRRIDAATSTEFPDRSRPVRLANNCQIVELVLADAQLAMPNPTSAQYDERILLHAPPDAGLAWSPAPMRKGQSNTSAVIGQAGQFTGSPITIAVQLMHRLADLRQQRNVVLRPSAASPVLPVALTFQLLHDMAARHTEGLAGARSRTTRVSEQSTFSLGPPTAHLRISFSKVLRPGGRSRSAMWRRQR